MSTDCSKTTGLTPAEVLAGIRKHVLLGGFGLVFDSTRSRGCRFYDAAGQRTLLDMYGFFASLPIGFNHPAFDRPEVREELVQASLTKVANTEIATRFYARFVETFYRVVGAPELDRLFLIDGGALAVENALKAAMDWKIRRNLAAGRGEIGTEVLHLRHAFHGRSGYTLSLTNTDPNKVMYFAKFDWPRVDSPAIDYTLAEPQRSQKAAADEQAAEAQIVEAIRSRPHRICAVILEPVQCEGGDRHFRKAWFQTLRRLCDEHELLLIFDEIQCGMGVTGKTWCCQHYDVLPDLLVFGKKAQICGVLASPRLDEVPDNVFRKPGRIASTWGGNLVDMVRSTHYLTLYEQQRLVENARAMGERFQQALRRLAKDFPVVSAVRGLGLLLAFDLPDTETRDRFWKTCFEVGLLINRCGSKSIRLRPVLDVSEADLEETVNLLGEALRRMSN